MSSKTLEYSPELFAAVMEHMDGYYLLGETVCGAEDPAVIELSDTFGTQYPDMAGLTIVRVSERYVSAWKSDTVLEFSSLPISATEWTRYDLLAGDS